MSPDKDKDILAKWIINEYDELGDSTLPKDVIHILKETNSLDIPKMDIDLVKSKIDDKVNGPKNKGRVLRLSRLLLAGAAVISLLLIATLIFNNDIRSSTGIGESLSIQLPDQSQVILSGKSTITYDKSFDERIVELKGEAFFDVAKGSKFVIKTEVGEVTVLGTSFNVMDRGGQLIVSCKTGKVGVNSGKFSTVLTPGRMVKVGTRYKELNNVEDVDVKQIGSWVNGEKYFKSTNLLDVVESLKTSYDIKLEIPSSYHDKSFTGSYVYNDLQKALKMIFIPMDISYTIDNENIVTIVE